MYMEWCLGSDAAGFSGHVFKFSSAVGRSLCEMSTAGNTKYETAAVCFFLHFRQHAGSRFPSAKKWYGRNKGGRDMANKTAGKASAE
ncbi:hypothetical protein, partial [Bacillus paralicheniformis]|uniref:hypothetical protein n=1 Tax=Bacillus paralicheniformis TaxID=1648923 RepID=UPI002DC0577E